MKYVSSLNYLVSDIAAVCSLLCNKFDFKIENESLDSILVNNGIITIRLLKATSGKSSNLLFDYSVDDLQSAQEELLEVEFKISTEKEKTSQFREQILMEGPFGISVMLYKRYTIDELGVYIELKTTLAWDEKALEITQELMKEVPVDFREMAKAKVVEAAESYAIVAGEIKVDFRKAVSAIIHTTPAFRQEQLSDTLKVRGINPHHFESN